MRETLPISPTADSDIPPPYPIVCPSPPPHEALLSAAFAAPVEQINLARQYLARYDRWLTDYADLQLPLPSRSSRLTGLPRFLNGRLPTILHNPDSEKPEPWMETAASWLFTRSDGPDAPPAPASCLFGLDDVTEARQQFRVLDAVMIPAARANAAIQDISPQLAATVHVRFQQVLGNRPVLGGRVIVHMADGDPRCSASSAYLPIPADRFAHCRLRSEAEAKDLAWRGLLQLDDQQTVPWDEARIVPYLPNLPGAADRPDPCFVLPFAGKYYLAYQVEILSAARDRGWRVYVNADADDASCHLLGRPEPLMAHSFSVFSTSEDALNNQPQQTNGQGLDLSFMTFEWHKDAVSAVPVLTLAEIEQPPPGLDANLIFDAGNVAHHADRFYRYFTSLCLGQKIADMLEDGWRKPPYFKVAVRGGSDQALSTGFLASAAAPTIIFQSADELAVGLRTVYRPAADPEVIYHELAHALMWLMNSEPFNMSAGVTPFARALVEGYANYYARACAVSAGGDAADRIWARACYRSTEFGDRFGLAHDSQRDPTGNLLPLPNLYPPPGPDPDANDPLTAQSLQKYSVGMVWARALWELREQLRITNRDPLWADRLALSAYFYMPGWLASFETAAEGILDQMTPAEAGRLAGQFGKRNILAGRGVQTLAFAGTDVLVGTDVGVRRSAANAIQWGPWHQFGSGEGVVALAHDATSNATLKTFAATERGIYAWDAGQSVWREHGTWKTNLTQWTPLCLVAANEMVYVGTARGVYALSAAAPTGNWTRWEGEQALEHPVRDIAVMHRPRNNGAEEDLVYVATLREARRRALAVNEGDPAGVQWGNAVGDTHQEQIAMTTAVALAGDKAYLGTLWQGIWRQEDLADNDSWVQIATAQNLGGGAVLTLRVRQAAAGLEVLAGTSAGLFRGRPTGAGGWTWSEIALDNNPNAHETITTALYLGDKEWLVGTANRGLWRATESNGQYQWTRYGDIGI